MEPYTPAELERVLDRSAGLLGVALQPAAGARDRRPLARHAPHREPAAAPGARLRRGPHAAAGSTCRSPATPCASTTSTSSGSTGSTAPCWRRWCCRFGGGPVGLSTLAVAVSEESETVEEVAEPFLVRSGLVLRTPRGRVATPAAWTHLGLAPPGPRPRPCCRSSCPADPSLPPEHGGPRTLGRFVPLFPVRPEAHPWARLRRTCAAACTARRSALRTRSGTPAPRTSAPQHVPLRA